MNISEDKKTSFAFKAHREDSDCYPVNMITFANNNILVTGSPDGTMYVWNKCVRKRICRLPECITKQTFGADVVDADFCRFNQSMM